MQHDMPITEANFPCVEGTDAFANVSHVLELFTKTLDDCEGKCWDNSSN